MTQQPLPLDQFSHIRAMVAARIDVAAYQGACGDPRECRVCAPQPRAEDTICDGEDRTMSQVYPCDCGGTAGLNTRVGLFGDEKAWTGSIQCGDCGTQTEFVEVGQRFRFVADEKLIDEAMVSRLVGIWLGKSGGTE